MNAPTELQSPKCYRVNLPVMALAFRDDHQGAVTIQAGEIFEVVGPAQDDRFVVVDAGGERFLVFDCDLRDRGEPVQKGPDHRPRAPKKAGQLMVAG